MHGARARDLGGRHDLDLARSTNDALLVAGSTTDVTLVCGAQVDRLRAPPGTDVTGNTKRLAHLTKQLLSNIYGSIHCFPLYAEMRLGRIPSDVA